MDSQVRVTLTSLNGGVTPSQRTFYLNSDRRKVSIGRASKSASKGLLGAPDNAWFDSPVMSRHHAEIAFNPEGKSLMIEDIGSMHGTFVNDLPLPKKVAMVVKDEDELKFGTEVRRGPETFPACRFSFNYDFVPFTSANSYGIPEYSDDEDCEEEDDEDEDDDEEDGFEFSDEVHKGQASSEDDISIASPLVSKLKKPDDHIDLTRDDSPLHSNLIDLTDDTPAANVVETRAEITLMEIMAGRPTDISGSASNTNIAVFAGQDLTVREDSEDGEVQFSPRFGDSSGEDLNDEDESSASESSDEEYGVDEVLADALRDSLNEDMEESEGLYHSDDPMEDDEDDENDVPLDAESAMTSMLRFANATNDYTICRLSEPLSADESSGDEEDDESDFGLSEAGAEGLRVLHDSGLLGKTEEALPPSMPTAAIITQAAEPQESHSVFKVRNTHNMTQSMVEKPKISSYVSDRQPSPSDAAMVKSQTTSTQASLPVSASAQALGEMSGKPDFFAAREINKRRFLIDETKKQAELLLQLNARSQISSGPVRTLNHMYASRLGEYPSDTTGQLKNKMEWGTLDSEPIEAAISSDGIQSNPWVNDFYVSAAQTQGHQISMMPRREECNFLDVPDTNPVVYRTTSPSLDMTSAVAFDTAKNTMLATTSVPKASMLKIQDLCTDTSPQPATLKRKAQDISSDSGEELRTWGNGTSQPLQGIPVATLPKDDELVNAPKTDISRPTKRFRRILENVGYVAIGGLTVGGALFGALVATAPEFA